MQHGAHAQYLKVQPTDAEMLPNAHRKVGNPLFVGYRKAIAALMRSQNRTDIGQDKLG
jgi:hypothetical protein